MFTHKNDGKYIWNAKNPKYRAEDSIENEEREYLTIPTSYWRGSRPKFDVDSEVHSELFTSSPLWAEPSGTTLGAQNKTSLPSRFKLDFGQSRRLLVCYIPGW